MNDIASHTPERHGSTSKTATSQSFNNALLLGMGVPEVDGPLYTIQGHHHPTSAQLDLNCDFLKDRRPDVWNSLVLTSNLLDPATKGRDSANDHRWTVPQRAALHEYVESQSSSMTSAYHVYSDSAYGSRDSRSVISSSCPFESSFPSPDVALPPRAANQSDRGLYMAPLRGEFNGERDGNRNTTRRPLLICSECNWMGKTPSEKKSVTASHRTSCYFPPLKSGREKSGNTRQGIERHINAKCSAAAPKDLDPKMISSDTARRSIAGPLVADRLRCISVSVGLVTIPRSSGHARTIF